MAAAMRQRQRSTSKSSALPTKMVKRRSKKRRLRKSKPQREALWALFKELKGEMPKRVQVLELVDTLGLKEQQVYKWFWDTKKRVESDGLLAD